MEYFQANLFLLLLLLLVTTQPACYGIEVTDTEIGVSPARVIRFQSEPESIDDLIGTYIDVLNTEEFVGLPFLPDQLGAAEPPRRWVAADVEGRIPDDQTRIITRDDNMYFSGFANKSGHVHAIKGHEGALPGATVVSTGDTYRDFMKAGPIQTIPQLLLSKELFQDDTHTLANYPNVPPEDFDMAVVRTVVMLCEAARIKKIRSRVKEIWESGAAGRLEKIHAEYCMNWSKMSLFILCAERGIELTGKDAAAMRKVEVSTTADVKGVLGVVLRPTRFDANNPKESCRAKRKKNVQG